jgi:C-terminal processing protease CtpA/Prc
MNKLLRYTSLIAILVFSISSCKLKDILPREQESETIKESEVNNWIYTKMKDHYLWESEMINISQSNLTLKPDQYFESILVKPGEQDRFSWIEPNVEELLASLNGVSTTFGLKTKPFYMNSARDRVVFHVVHALKTSAAERAGIKRGDIITKVNGVNITADNYQTVFSEETVTVTLGTYSNGEVIDSETAVEMTKEVTKNDALQFDTILEIGGKKIGYFVYTQFLRSNDNDLNTMFGGFKSAGITELVVDLRDNPGGYISSAELLSSLIVKNLDEKNLMARQVWNSKQTALYTQKYGKDVFDTYFFKSKSGIGTINNTGTLDRVYFIVTPGSASASEQLINNLKPYMEVILVGGHTYGKNVGSITISDSEKRWDWGMQPIVLKSVNANGESDFGTKLGFLPDIEVNDNLLPYKSYGDPDETMLQAALRDIVGETALVKLRKSGKLKPSGRFESLSIEAISDNPVLDRKDMFITKFPGE